MPVSNEMLPRAREREFAPKLCCFDLFVYAARNSFCILYSPAGYEVRTQILRIQKEVVCARSALAQLNKMG